MSRVTVLIGCAGGGGDPGGGGGVAVAILPVATHRCRQGNTRDPVASQKKGWSCDSDGAAAVPNGWD
jgi:hypothetical protein